MPAKEDPSVQPPHIDANPTQYDRPDLSPGWAWNAKEGRFTPPVPPAAPANNPVTELPPVVAHPPAEPTPPTPNAGVRVIGWYERQSPAVRGAIIALVGAALAKLCPDLLPLLRLVAGTPSD